MIAARLIASFLGAGYAKQAPGTVGSLAALVPGVALMFVPFALPLGALLATFGGLWAIHRARAGDDPQWVVIDEVAGMWIALLGLARPSSGGVILAFLLFRLLDILKPGPIGWADRQHGAAAVMADDVIAGAIAAGILWAVQAAGPVCNDGDHAMIDRAILAQAETLLQRCREAGLTVATAESCTGGLIAATLTAIAGSSDVVDRGFVTYSNAAKTELIEVPASLIAAHGAVSEPVAQRMAEGALAHSAADIAISVTGVAGPGGGTTEKPVGLVWFGCARRGKDTVTHRDVFPGDRTAVRRATVAQALTMLGEAI